MLQVLRPIGNVSKYGCRTKSRVTLAKRFCTQAKSSSQLAEEMRYKGGFLKLGNWESITKKIGGKEIELFAELSEDHNPLHLDAQFAATTQFKKRIAHGMLSSILISAVAGMKMPGQGSIYLNQTLSFKKPVYIDDTVTATCVVASIRETKRIVKMETNVHNQHGELVIAGEALVLAPPHTVDSTTPTPTPSS